MGENAQNPQDLVQNPIGEELHVEVTIPKKIEIKMVNASSLGDYEVWVFITSIICNFFVGFIVATISSNDHSIRSVFYAVDVLFFVLLLVSGWMVLKKRKRMAIETTTIPLSVKKKQ